MLASTSAFNIIKPLNMIVRIKWTFPSILMWEEETQIGLTEVTYEEIMICIPSDKLCINLFHGKRDRRVKLYIFKKGIFSCFWMVSSADPTEDNTAWNEMKGSLKLSYFHVAIKSGQSLTLDRSTESEEWAKWTQHRESSNRIDGVIKALTYAHSTIELTSTMA